MKIIEVIGYGVVGQGMAKLFRERFEVIIHDPEKGFTRTDESPIPDLGIICVPTPMKDDGSCETAYVESAIKECKAKLVLIKSTIPPETTIKFAKKFKKQICFSPEYMGESKYFTPFWKYPDPENAASHTFVIIGGEKASEIANYFMKVMSVDTVYHLCSATEAELIKYAENTFFATKVTFCNEFYDICQAFGVDWKGVREGWLLDPRINKNHTLVFDDDRAWSGKCFPKDICAIIKASESKGYSPEFLKEVVKSNGRHSTKQEMQDLPKIFE